MQVLYELVTVIREQRPRYHWETGKMADAWIYESGDLPECCTVTRGIISFQTTSNWLYIRTEKAHSDDRSFFSFLCVQTLYLIAVEGFYYVIGKSCERLFFIPVSEVWYETPQGGHEQ